jgi:hypothetical protein
VGLLSGLRAPADRLTAAARRRPSRGTRRAQQLLAAALAISAAVPIWAQSHPSPSIAQSSHVSNADGPQAIAGSSSTPDYQLDRSEEDWSGLCRQAKFSQLRGLTDRILKISCAPSCLVPIVHFAIAFASLDKSQELAQE